MTAGKSATWIHFHNKLFAFRTVELLKHGIIIKMKRNIREGLLFCFKLQYTLYLRALSTSLHLGRRKDHGYDKG